MVTLGLVGPAVLGSPVSFSKRCDRICPSILPVSLLVPVQVRNDSRPVRRKRRTGLARPSKSVIGRGDGPILSAGVGLVLG